MHVLASLRNQHSYTPPHQPPTTMERRDHGRALKQQQQLPTWTPGHNFSLAAGYFPWPPQRSPSLPLSSSYTCGYCRREFRSAQALGGHMNVHRRDRARLRQCCSPAWPSSLPLPGGPNHLAAPPPHPQQRRAPLPNLNCSPPHCAGAAAAEAAPVIYSFFSTTASTTVAAATTKAPTFEVSLELGIGVCGGRGGEAVEEEGLDLELRLGCAWE